MPLGVNVKSCPAILAFIVGWQAQMAYAKDAVAPASPPSGLHSQSSTKPRNPGTILDRMYDLAGPNAARSLRELNNLIQSHPKSPELYLQRGHAYFIDGDYENALKDYKQALAVDPGCMGAHIAISRVLRGMGKTEEGFKELRIAEEKGNHDVATSAIWESAFVHREHKQMDISLEQYNKCIEEGLVGKSRQAYALFQRGELYLRINKLDKALPDLNEAIKMDPSGALFHTVRAQIYARLNKPKEQLADLSFAIEAEKNRKLNDPMGLAQLGGHLPDLYNTRGRLYQQLGKNDLAERDFKEAKAVQVDALNTVPFQSMPWNPPNH